jgi:N-methylhydantoinase B
MVGSDPVRDFPNTISGDFYRAARAMNGFVNAETGELDPAGTYHPSGIEFEVDKGSFLRIVSNGAGGWGDPLRRDPGRVLIDVRDGYVSIAGAARDYGVVVRGDPDHDPEGLAIDEAATMRLRREMAQTRSAA